MTSISGIFVPLTFSCEIFGEFLACTAHLKPLYRFPKTTCYYSLADSLVMLWVQFYFSFYFFSGCHSFIKCPLKPSRMHSGVGDGEMTHWCWSEASPNHDTSTFIFQLVVLFFIVRLWFYLHLNSSLSDLIPFLNFFTTIISSYIRPQKAH